MAHATKKARVSRDNLAQPFVTASSPEHYQVSDQNSSGTTTTLQSNDSVRHSLQKRVGRATVPNIPRFRMPKCQTPSKKEMDPVEQFVSSAIREKTEESKDFIDNDNENKRENPPSYTALLETVKKKEDPAMLLKVLLVLRSSSSALTQITSKQGHGKLIRALLIMNPFVPHQKIAQNHVGDEEFFKLYEDYSIADAYLHLIVGIVSANTIYLHATLTNLWKVLTFQDQKATPITEQTAMEREERIHAAIATILTVVPKAVSTIFPIMSTFFPFRTLKKEFLLHHTKHCLKLLQYAPALAGQVWALLIDKSLEIDVEIKITDTGEASIEQEKKKQDPLDDENDDVDLSVPSPPPLDSEDVNHMKVDEMADKLDGIMLIMFENIEMMTKRDPSYAKTMYQLLKPVFDSNILTTFKSKYVQFLILVVCGKDPSLPHPSLEQDHEELQDTNHLYREFAEHLIETIYNHYRATITRQTAVCYLASFCCRANYVCAETVCEVIAALLRWAEAYLLALSADQQRSMLASDVRNQCEMHCLFYCVCQACFYMMCFRGGDAMAYYENAVNYWKKNEYGDIEEAEFPELEAIELSAQRWKNLCAHHFQPLRFCLESVREEFLHVAEEFNFFEPSLLLRLSTDSKSIATKGRKKSLPRGQPIGTPLMRRRRNLGGVGGLGKGSNPLDSFFPFDPYLLRQSHHFVDSYYKHWNGSTFDETVGEGKQADLQENGDGMVHEEEPSLKEHDDGERNCEDGNENDSVNTVGSDDSSSVQSQITLSSTLGVSQAEVKTISIPQRLQVVQRVRGASIESKGSW